MTTSFTKIQGSAVGFALVVAGALLAGSELSSHWRWNRRPGKAGICSRSSRGERALASGEIVTDFSLH